MEGRSTGGGSLAIVGVAVGFDGNDEVTLGMVGTSSADRETSSLDFEAVGAGA